MPPVPRHKSTVVYTYVWFRKAYTYTFAGTELSGLGFLFRAVSPREVESPKMKECILTTTHQERVRPALQIYPVLCS
jgi:hypothetical protein